MASTIPRASAVTRLARSRYEICILILSLFGGVGSNVITNIASFSIMLESVDPSVNMLKQFALSSRSFRSLAKASVMKSIITPAELSLQYEFPKTTPCFSLSLIISLHFAIGSSYLATKKAVSNFFIRLKVFPVRYFKSSNNRRLPNII